MNTYSVMFPGSGGEPEAGAKSPAAPAAPSIVRATHDSGPTRLSLATELFWAVGLVEPKSTAQTYGEGLEQEQVWAGFCKHLAARFSLRELKTLRAGLVTGAFSRLCLVRAWFAEEIAAIGQLPHVQHEIEQAHRARRDFLSPGQDY